jgi:hypothetical protein
MFSGFPLKADMIGSPAGVETSWQPTEWRPRLHGRMPTEGTRWTKPFDYDRFIVRHCPDGLGLLGQPEEPFPDAFGDIGQSAPDLD